MMSVVNNDVEMDVGSVTVSGLFRFRLRAGEMIAVGTWYFDLHGKMRNQFHEFLV